MHINTGHTTIPHAYASTTDAATSPAQKGKFLFRTAQSCLLNEDDIKIISDTCTDEEIKSAYMNLDRLVNILKTNKKKILPLPSLTYIAPSEIAGQGVVADTDFQKHDEIGEYRGQKVYRYFHETEKDYFFAFTVDNNGLTKKNLPRHMTYLGNDKHVAWTSTTIGSSEIEIGINGCGNLKYSNHSAKPNFKLITTYLENTIPWEKRNELTLQAIAIKGIKRDEELCFDYLDGEKSGINFDINQVKDIKNDREYKQKIEKALTQTIFRSDTHKPLKRKSDEFNDLEYNIPKPKKVKLKDKVLAGDKQTNKDHIQINKELSQVG